MFNKSNQLAEKDHLLSRTRALDGHDEDGVGPRGVLVHVGRTDSSNKSIILLIRFCDTYRRNKTLPNVSSTKLDSIRTFSSFTGSS